MHLGHFGKAVHLAGHDLGRPDQSVQREPSTKNSAANDSFPAAPAQMIMLRAKVARRQLGES
jgi:hypothetical protein